MDRAALESANAFVRRVKRRSERRVGKRRRGFWDDRMWEDDSVVRQLNTDQSKQTKDSWPRCKRYG